MVAGEVSVVVPPDAGEVPDEAVVTTMPAAAKAAKVLPLVLLVRMIRAQTWGNTAVEEVAEEEVEAAEGGAERVEEEEVKEGEDGGSSLTEVAGADVTEGKGEMRPERLHPPCPRQW